MIPIAYIIQWRENSPWSTTEQIEQDLILSRILIELYSDPFLREKLIFRGGTALHKLFINPPARYSEDIDLVQLNAGPIGPCLQAIRQKLDHWLGSPTWKIKPGRVVFYYRFFPESSVPRPMRIKIEINTREHFNHFDLVEIEHTFNNSWFSGNAWIKTFCLEELLGTKLRALYQRKKGRDLFDLFVAFLFCPHMDISKVITAFQRYINHDNSSISRAEFEANLRNKLDDPVFHADIQPLLSDNVSFKYDVVEAAEMVFTQLIAKLPGEPWKGKPES